MNSLQHYQEGERLLAFAQKSTYDPSMTVSLAHAHFAAALVGATMTQALDLDQPGMELYEAAVIGS